MLYFLIFVFIAIPQAAFADPISAALVGTMAAAGSATAGTVGLLGAGGMFSSAGLLTGAMSGLGGIAAGLGGLSGLMSARQASATAKTNAAIAEDNARIERQKTKAALQKQDMDRRLRAGSAKAGSGASGIGTQSYGDLLQSNAVQEELDMLTIKNEGILSENNYLNEAAQQRAKAKSSKGLLNTATSILGGAAPYLR